jgi:GLPGLI family protein
MKFNLILLISIISLSFLQEIDDKHYNVVYKLKFKLNKDQDYYATETFSLIGNDQVSVFESQGRFLTDSLLKDGNITSHLQLPNTNFNYTLFKRDNKYKVQATIGISALFEYVEDANKKWRLTQEAKIINGYNCLLAQLAYGGREWDVWYTLDIPIQNGPFKFDGLPGLVVQAQDDTKSYIFTLHDFVQDSKTDLNYRMKEDVATMISREIYLQYRYESTKSYLRRKAIAGEPSDYDNPLDIREIDKKYSKQVNFLELE